MSQRIAVMINELGASQLAYFVVRSMNAFLTANPLADAVILYRQYSSVYTQTFFATMPTECIHEFRGTVVTTDLESTKCAVMYGHKPIFYVNDLEWIRGRTNFMDNVKTYREAIRLICRSEDHADALVKYAGIDRVEVMPVFNIAEILNG